MSFSDSEVLGSASQLVGNGGLFFSSLEFGVLAGGDVGVGSPNIEGNFEFPHRNGTAEPPHAKAGFLIVLSVDVFCKGTEGLDGKNGGRGGGVFEAAPQSSFGAALQLSSGGTTP